MKISTLFAAGCMAAAAYALPASAAYPEKPVNVIVGFAPGGTNDILARLVSSELEKRLGQTFIVENKPGANSMISANYVKAATAARARWINQTTRQQLQAELDGDEPDTKSVFEKATNQRALAAGQAIAAAMAGFAVVEAAKQAAPGQCLKEWVTYAKNPRPSHQAMNGEMTGVRQAFSNGMQWPGDPAGGADEVAGCTCSINLHHA